MRKIFPLIFFVVAATYGLFRPELFNFHEQYQFFVFDLDYLVDHLIVPSEMSDYVAEFFVQFFIFPLLGSAVFAGLATALGFVVRALAEKYSGSPCNTALAFLPSAAVAIYFCDDSVMLAYPVAIIIALLMSLAYIRIDGRRRYLWQLVALPLVYWITGYGVWLYLIATLLFDVRKRGLDVRASIMQFAAMSAYLLLFVVVMANTALVQYTYRHLLLGCNFYRMPMQWPWGQHIVALVAIVAIFRIGKVSVIRRMELSLSAIVMAVLLIGCHTNYDKTKSELMRLCYWVRFQKWEQIVAFSEKTPLNNDIAISANNLALAQLGQLPSRYSQFPQNGIEGLVPSFKFNMVFNLTSAEVCYYIGFVDQALRFNYDSQAAIFNKRFSAAFSRRIAECYMLNGDYDAARMYTVRLRKTIFYSQFAKKLDDCMENPARIAENPRWRMIQSSRISNDEFFFRPSKFFHLLSQMCENGAENPVAHQYFLVSGSLK